MRSQSMPLPEINGDVPKLVGKVCQALLVQQHWYKGVLNEEVNTAYIACDEHWYCLYIDCGIIYWRGDRKPEEFHAPEFAAHYPVIDVGTQRDCVGRVISDLMMREDESTTEIEIRFEGADAIVFRNTQDRTHICSTTDQPNDQKR